MKKVLFGLIAASLAPAGVNAEALEERATVGEVMESATSGDWRALDQKNLLYIELERGRVVVALSESLAQQHVAQMRALAREKFYDGLSFYRVIDGFVAQGGDVLEKREVKVSAKSLPPEFEETRTDEISFDDYPDGDGYSEIVGFVDGIPTGYDRTTNTVWHLHCTGAMAMARDTPKDTGGTEIYITLQPQRYLDRNLSVFGRVVEGMEHLQALRRVAPAQSADDDLGEKIISVRIGSDLSVEEQLALKVLKTNTSLFENYVNARQNRAADFFYFRPDYMDICQLPMPVEPIIAAASE